MSELEKKLSSLLDNPQLMQQIMTMAQSINPQPPTPQKPPQEEPSPVFDPALLQNLSRFANSNQPDPQQQALLSALGPYLSRHRVAKLERAMRASRLAGAASSFLNAGGLQLLSGR